MQNFLNNFPFPGNIGQRATSSDVIVITIQ